MKAFAYIRVSGKAQVDGDGPDRQADKIKKFAQEHTFIDHPLAMQSGLPVYFDRGISGTVEAMDRPEFINLLAFIETNHPYSVHGSESVCIIVERMDRLARDLMVQEMLLAECRKRHIKVYAVDQGLVDVANDGGDPSRTLIRQIFGAIAQWEKSVIVLKTRAARDRIRKSTGRCEGVKPYGSLPGEDEILRHIESWSADGLPHRTIAGSLNLSGFRTRHGKEWTKKHVAQVLQTQRKNKQ